MSRMYQSRGLRVWAILLFALGATGTARTVVAQPRPGLRSPFAISGQSLFAVDQDGRTLLTRGINEGSRWQRMPRQVPASNIRGLATGGGMLFIADAPSATVYALPLAGPGDFRVLHSGPPLVRPGELAYTGELIVADPGARALFRINPAEPAPRRLILSDDVNITDATYLVGNFGELVLTDADQGRIAQITDLTRPDGANVWTMQQRAGTGQSPVQRYEGDSDRRPRSVRAMAYPGVDRPGSVALFNGIVYVMDESKPGQMFAAPIHDARAVRLPLMAQDGVVPTRVAATATDLFALDAERQQVARWPRLVLVEVRLNEPSTEALSAFYGYLLKNNLLPTRMVTSGAPIAGTLVRENVLPAADTRPFAAVFCQMNASVCTTRTTMPDQLPAGQRVAIPELYSERYIDVTQVTLDGSQTLGEIAERQVTTTEFSFYRSEEHLRTTNGVAGAAESLRNVRTGTYRVPTERVRYIAAVPVNDARNPDSELGRLTRQHKALRVIPLERVRTALASSGGGQPIGSDENAQKAFDQMKKAIAYAMPGSPAVLPAVRVGIGDKQFDPGHPDFVDPNGASVFIQLDHRDSPSARRLPVISPRSPGNGPLTYRALERERDHGTAIASLIAARHRPFGGQGLAPNTFVIPLPDEDPDLSQDIENSIVDYGASVFNLSLKLDRESSALFDQIERRQEAALFVVAAGNGQSTKVLCEGNLRVFPACWGHFKNVIVVGGTNLDGVAIQTDSNRGKAVHLVAPAEGYFAAGDGQSYVPVAGNSFSTALVSAAAATLSALGVTAPTKIKQRLVATADVDRNLPDWARRLNVTRAISHLGYAVLTTENDKQQVVLLAEPPPDTPPPPPPETLRFRLHRTSSSLQLGMATIRRLTPSPTNSSVFNLAYEDVTENTLKIVQVDRPSGQWRFCYQPLNAQFQPSGAVDCTGDLLEYKDYVGPIK